MCNNCVGEPFFSTPCIFRIVLSSWRISFYIRTMEYIFIGLIYVIYQKHTMGLNILVNLFTSGNSWSASRFALFDNLFARKINQFQFLYETKWVPFYLWYIFVFFIEIILGLWTDSFSLLRHYSREFLVIVNKVKLSIKTS